MGVFAWCVFLWVGFTVGVLCCGWSGGFIEWVVVFHVKHGGMVELWGRQFEKYHFSPTCYRGVSVSRGTSVRDVLGLGGLFMGAGLFRSFWFYGDVVVSRETWWVIGFYLEAYSGAGKTQPQKQVENQKENAI